MAFGVTGYAKGGWRGSAYNANGGYQRELERYQTLLGAVTNPEDLETVGIGDVALSVVKKGITVFSAVADFLSRPRYAITGVIDTLAGNGKPGEWVPQRVVRELFSGIGPLKGDKENFGEVLEQMGVGEGGRLSDVIPGWEKTWLGKHVNPSARGTFALGLDIMIDPATWVTAPAAFAPKVVTSTGDLVPLSEKGLKLFHNLRDTYYGKLAKRLNMGDNWTPEEVISRAVKDEKFLQENAWVGRLMTRPADLEGGELIATQAKALIRAKLDRAFADDIYKAVRQGEAGLVAKSGLQVKYPLFPSIPVKADQALVKVAGKGLGKLRTMAETHSKSRPWLRRAIAEFDDFMDETYKIFNRVPRKARQLPGFNRLAYDYWQAREAVDMVASSVTSKLTTGVPEAVRKDTKLWLEFADALEGVRKLPTGEIEYLSGSALQTRRAEWIGMAKKAGIEDPKKFMDDWIAWMDSVGKTEADLGLLDPDKVEGLLGRYFPRMTTLDESKWDEIMDRAVAQFGSRSTSRFRGPSVHGHREDRFFQSTREFYEFLAEQKLEHHVVLDPAEVLQRRIKVHQLAVLENQFLNDVMLTFGLKNNPIISEIEQSLTNAGVNPDKTQLERAGKLIEFFDDIRFGKRRTNAAIRQYVMETADRVLAKQRYFMEAFFDRAKFEKMLAQNAGRADVPGLKEAVKYKLNVKAADALATIQGTLVGAYDGQPYLLGLTLKDAVGRMQRKVGLAVQKKNPWYLGSVIEDTNRLVLRTIEAGLAGDKLGLPVWTKFELKALRREASAFLKELKKLPTDSVGDVGKAKLHLEKLAVRAEKIDSFLDYYKKVAVDGAALVKTTKELQRDLMQRVRTNASKAKFSEAAAKAIRRTIKESLEPVSNAEKRRDVMLNVFRKMDTKTKAITLRAIMNDAQTTDEVARALDLMAEVSNPSFWDDLIKSADNLPTLESTFLPDHIGAVSDELKSGTFSYMGQTYRKFLVQEGGLKGRTLTLPEGVVEYLQNYRGVWQQNPEVKKAVAILDFLTNTFKVAVTTYFPSFNFRNAYTNVISTAADVGLNALDPRFHKKAIDILLGRDGTFVLSNGRRVTYETLRRELKAAGLWVDRRDLIELTGKRRSIDPIKDVLDPIATRFTKGKFQPGATAQGLVGNIENEARIMHYLVLRRRGYTHFDAIRRVNEFLFDYADLSPTQRNVLRRIFPFYTWTEKNIRRQIKNMYERPAMFTILQSLENNLRGPEAETLPEYLRGQTAITLDSGDVLAGLDLPQKNINVLWKGGVGKTLKEGFGLLNPLVKMPIELATGIDTFDGKNIYGRQWLGRIGPMLDRNFPAAMKQWLELEKITTKSGEEVYRANGLKLYLLTKGLFLGRFLSTASTIDEFARDFGQGDPAKGAIGALRFLTGLQLRDVNLTDEQAAALHERTRELEDYLLEKGYLREFKKRYLPKQPEEPLRIRR